MISKKARLPKQKFFARPLNQTRSEYFSLKNFRNELGHNRFGLIISARVDKRSSLRHFWRRLILEYVKGQPDAHQDFLITASPRLRELSADQIRAELEKVFRKIRTPIPSS